MHYRTIWASSRARRASLDILRYLRKRQVRCNLQI
ncbi:hypothetical protein MUK42_34305 [Musa troglodytarum]|uniref:Uncharacterized protein n=1 Tax=Musa troglodytarum TaxID=320322 RepID=A0A9E7JAT7_9LILI|nr:hypothetical protein MUK42_34305 [Musa troglodytarum]